MQCRGDMLILANTGDQSSSSVQYCVQPTSDLCGDAMQDSVAVVDATCDEHMYKSAHGIVWN